MNEKGLTLKIFVSKYSTQSLVFKGVNMFSSRHYLGMAHLLNVGIALKSTRPDTARARAYFEKSLATKEEAFTEYELAEVELRRLGDRSGV